MDPNNRLDQKDQAAKADTGSGATGGTATGAAATQNVLSDEKGTDPAHTEETIPGAFGPFRYYINSKLRNMGEAPTVKHAGEYWHVQELTSDGRLRLKDPNGDNFALVPLDERYIPEFLAQIP